MIIDRFGIRPAPSKIEAITQLSQPSTAEEVRVLLGMTGCLRKFVPNYSSVLSPISDLLRDSRFRSKKARPLKVLWGQTQTEVMETLISLLISPPIFALPEWNKPFRLYTDASETGAGAVQTNFRKWSKKLWPTQATDGRRPMTKRPRLIVNA